MLKLISFNSSGSKESISFENLLHPIEEAYLPVQYTRSLTEAGILLQHANNDTFSPIRLKVSFPCEDMLRNIFLHVLNCFRR